MFNFVKENFTKFCSTFERKNFRCEMSLKRWSFHRLLPCWTRQALLTDAAEQQLPLKRDWYSAWEAAKQHVCWRSRSMKCDHSEPLITFTAVDARRPHASTDRVIDQPLIPRARRQRSFFISLAENVETRRLCNFYRMRSRRNNTFGSVRLRACVSVRLSVGALLFELFDLWPWFLAWGSTLTLASLGL